MKKIFSILLSIILLSGHMFLTVGTHYCGGEAIETKIMLGEKHLDCGMMVMEEPCDEAENSSKNGIRFDKVPCCENKYQKVELSSEFVKDATQPSFNIDFTVALIYKTLNLNLFQKSTAQFYTEYISPPLEKDIPVLFQTFLI